MSGLTSSYILAKLAATGTTAATKAIILEYLNAVPDAAALAGEIIGDRGNNRGQK